MKKNYQLQLFAISFIALLLFSFTSKSQHIHEGSNHPSNCKASPIPTDILQADNTTITIIGKGNLNNHWTETTDGHSIALNSSGIYEYAKKQNGELVPDGIKANNPSSRNLAEQTYLSNVPFSLMPDLNPLKSSVLNQLNAHMNNKVYPTSGNIRVLALLIDYPDLAHTYNARDFDSLLYGANFRNGDGSFKVFYETSSDSILTIDVDVKGWFRADSSYIYYGRDSGTSRAADLVREAVDAAEIAGVNFANYDNNNDNRVDGILAVHAGPGAEQGSRTQYIWSHRWVLNGGSSGQVTYDGVVINDYMINPEVRTSGATQRLVGIGVFCHEFGHNLGLPDLYDTDDSNGDSEGIGEWGLMGSAGYLGGENRPGNFCAWSKEELGWITPTNLTVGASGIYSLKAASTNLNQVFKINTSQSNEYFLLENRQKVGLDSDLRGKGLAIWHINTTKTNTSGNRVNGDESLKGVDLEEADGTDDLDSNANRGDTGDLYPGIANNTTFNNTSTPNSKNYSFSSSNVSISNISETSNVISFLFGKAPGSPCNATTTLTATTGSFDDGGGNLDYAHLQNCSWLIQPPSGTITLTFSAFDTQAGFDSVTVYDGSNASATLVGNFSGTSIPTAITSSSNSLYIEFHSDSTITSDGWSASYISSAPGTCDDTLTAPSGTFTDGSGPNIDYTDNLNCTWLIQPTGYSTIEVKFDSLATESGNDTINIYDGLNNSATLIGTYSGNSIPAAITSTGASVFIEFNTNGSIVDSGFQITYTGLNICTGTDTLTTSSGTFNDGSGSTVNYSPSQNCKWLIQPIGATSINLSWNYFTTETTFDIVNVYDGNNSSAPSLGTFSGSTLPSNLSSTNGSMYLEFSSNPSTEFKGFEVSYTSNFTTLTASPDTVYLNPGLGSQGNFNVSSNSAWTISDNASWLVVNPVSGNLNATIGLLAVQANIGPERYAEVYVSSTVDNTKDTLIVAQLSSGKYLIANPDTLYFDANPPAAQAINLAANVNWTLASSATWFSIGTTTGSNNGTSNITAQVNPLNTMRQDFVVASGSNGVANDTIYVVQNEPPPPPPSLSVNPNSINLAAISGSNSTFDVNSNVVWQTVSGATWLTVTNPSSTSDTNMVQISTNTTNVSTTNRSTFVAVQDVSGSLFDTVIVTQLGSSIMLSASPSSLTLNNPQGSNASTNLTANINWTATSGASWLSANPSNGSSNASITVTANSNNPASADRVSYIALEGGGGAIVDTIFVTQIGVQMALSVNPNFVVLAQPINSVGSFTINSNVSWQTLSGASWLTLTNPANTSDTGTVQLTANSANPNPNPRESYVAVQDVNGTLFDTVKISQLGTNATLSSNPDTLILAGTINSSANFSLVSNGNWTLAAADNWISPSLTSGNGSSSISVTSNSANTNLTSRTTYIAIEDVGNNLFDTIIVIQESITQQISTSPDTIRIGSGVGNQGTFTVNAPAQTTWTSTPRNNWINLSQTSGSGISSILVSANSANPSKNERMTYIVTQDNKFIPQSDTVYVIQDGLPSVLDVTPSTLNLNSTMGSNDAITVTSNLNWTVSNPVTWLSINPANGSNNGTVNATANSDNLSGANRSATLTFSAVGVVDKTVLVTQIDGSNPNFDVSRDTVYIDNPQGSIGKFAVLSNIANWSITENTPWILLNPQSGSNTETITVLVATRNVNGNNRSAEVTVSASGFADKIVTIIQKASTPLFQAAPSKLIVGPNIGDFADFNISSNLTAWNVSTNETWMGVSPSSGSFTSQVRVSATEKNTTGNVRNGIITIEAAPLVPQTILVTQDTLRTVGIQKFEFDENLQLYPNPTSGNVTLEFGSNVNSNEVTYALFSMLGNKIEMPQLVYNGSTALLKLEGMAKGIYFLQMNYKGTVISRKISVVE